MTVERIRGRKLQALRQRIWLLDPCCARCRHITLLSTFELDHAIALTNGGTNEDTNLQVLCLDCHEVKTNEDLGYRVRQTIGLDGYPIEGTTEQSRAARWRRAAAGKRR